MFEVRADRLSVSSWFRVVEICSSEESEQALDGISKLDIVPFLMGLLKLSGSIPETVRSLAAQCLSSLTEDNDALTSKFIDEQAEFVPHLLRLTEDKSPMVRMCACGLSLLFAPGPARAEISEL